jgi:arylsulfatase A-like enzyme
VNQNSQHSPILSLAIALIACLALQACSDSEEIKTRNNILLITIDTLRADHLSSYGYPRITSPVIDRLAEEGVRFELPIVQWPKTAPSFASIFTATYPKDNGIVRKVGDRLPYEFKMLAEVLRDQGYATRAVVANGAVASEFRFNQGFGDYVESWKLAPPSGDFQNTSAEMITELAKTIMADHDPSQPYFLWVHYLDPHFPYEPPQPWTDRFQGDEYYDASIKIDISRDHPKRQMTGIGFQQKLGGSDELAFYVARYDAEIFYADAQIGALLEDLESRGLLEQTLTVVSSDHGESLGDHNYFFDHGRFGFQPGLRVPLILNFPGVIEPRVETGAIELINLGPTLLEAAGVTLQDRRWMQGISLWSYLRGDETALKIRPLAFSEAGYAVERRWQRIVTDGRYKLIYAQAVPEQRWIAGKGSPLALFDLKEDPGETKNVYDQRTREAERLTRILHEAWETDPFEVLIDTSVGGEQREMDEETREQLKALGYLD